MTTIIIKSFNRAYYLDKCLWSICKFVKGDYCIRVLDDGTPEKYLNKIKKKYQDVIIIKSNYYIEKVDAIKNYLSGSEFEFSKIPSNFWSNEIANTTPSFILLEDDMWFTSQIDLCEIEFVMGKGYPFLRLFWQGNDRLIRGDKCQISESIDELTPYFKLSERLIFLNKLKLRSFLFRLGILKDFMKYQLPFYVLYSVAGAVFMKDYWLHLWSNAEEKVFEEEQLKKAFQWYEINNNKIAKTRYEVLQTSYITSSSNTFTDLEFDMFWLNHQLNEAWFLENLDSTISATNDFDIMYLSNFLKNTNRRGATLEQWSQWIERFKRQYRLVGCEVL